MYVKGNRVKARRRLALKIGAAPLAAIVFLTVAFLARDASASTKNVHYVVLGTIESLDNTGSAITVKLSDGTEITLRLAKRLVVNGREERMSRAVSALAPQERAVISYRKNGAEETAVDVESLDHAMPGAVTGTMVSADQAAGRLVLRLADGREEAFKVKNGAVIETSDGVATFDQLHPQQDAQITLHYRNASGMTEVIRVRR